MTSDRERQLWPAAIDALGSRLASVREGAVVITSLTEDEAAIEVALEGVRVVAFGEAGDLVAATDTAIHAIDIDARSAVRVAEHKLGGVSALACSDSGRLVAIACGPELVTLDLEDFEARSRCHYGRRDVFALRFKRGGRLIASLDDGTTDVRLVERSSPREGEASEDGEAEPSAPLIPPGNRLRWGQGGAITAAGLVLGLLNLILPGGSRAGVVVGSVAALIVTFGVLHLLGSFDDESEARPTPAGDLARPIALFGAASLALFLALRLAVSGVLQPGAAALTIPACFIGVVSALGFVLERLGVLGGNPPWHRREGYWLIVFATIVLLPSLGSHSLSDPWETHYGEVSREILARQDWISLWWAQEEWFWSKPILDFWAQAIAMALLGVRYEPGGMLALGANGPAPWPEWAVRFPIFLFAVLATYLLYKAVARVFGRRAGLISGVALTTMPQWFFIAHQTMTDMPFVATMVASLGAFLLGASEDPDRPVRVFPVRFGRRTLSLSGHQLALGPIVAMAVPQILYLFTRNLRINLDPVFGLRVPPVRLGVDTFTSGSAGNCGLLPGNLPCVESLPAYAGFHPAIQALLWTQALGLVLYLTWGERRAQRLYFLAAFFFAALATMAKGPAGIVIPAVAALGYVFVTRRWSLLLSMELAAGVMVLVAVAMPWFIAMFVRHGQKFSDRLLFHDMFKRAFEHVHDTNRRDDTSFRYYVWQLGYATFPWVGAIPAALARAFADGERSSSTSRERDDERGATGLFVVWLVSCFALFSLMQTKFHHYAFPAVPPIAALLGIAIDRALGAGGPSSSPGRSNWYALAPAIAGPAVAFAFMRATERSPSKWIAAGLLMLAGVLATLVVNRRAPASARPAGSATLALAALFGAGTTALVGRDLFTPFGEQPGDARLLHLFTYNYERAWPESLHFSSTLVGFTFAASLFLALAASERLRRGAAIAFVSTAAAFSVFCLDDYLVQTSPHWGQRETMLTYVTLNGQAPGPLIAYEMNWKGENFYTGNKVAAFPESGKSFRDWLGKQRGRGQKVFYVVLLPGRLGSLTSQLGRTREVEQLTTDAQNNKFLLVRATYD